MSLHFARQTDVSSDRSKAEIEHLLMKAGAEEFAHLSSRGKAAIMFTIKARRYNRLVAKVRRLNRKGPKAWKNS